MRACDVSLQGTFEGKMGIIADTLRENYFMIFLSMLVLGIAIFFIWLLVNNILGIMKTYHRFSKKTDDSVQAAVIKDKSDDVVQMEIANILSEGETATGDDYKPAPVLDDNVLKEPTTESENIQQKIDEIKNIYSAYNKQITDYSRDVQKKEPGDLMDERIISRKNDV